MTKHKRMLDSGNESVCENNFEILTSLNFSTHFRHENKTIFAFSDPRGRFADAQFTSYNPILVTIYPVLCL